MTDHNGTRLHSARRHLLKLQSAALLVGILGLPFLLYLAAQRGQDVLVSVLLGLMTAIMLGIIAAG